MHVNMFALIYYFYKYLLNVFFVPITENIVLVAQLGTPNFMEVI